MIQPQLSSCCNAPIQPVTSDVISDEGTGYNLCSKCKRDCDPKDMSTIYPVLCDCDGERYQKKVKRHQKKVKRHQKKVKRHQKKVKRHQKKVSCYLTQEQIGWASLTQEQVGQIAQQVGQIAHESNRIQRDIVEMDVSTPKQFENFLHYYYNTPCEGCADGHASFWKSIIESPQWKEWEKVGQYDFSECNELGIMSTKHFQEFIQFIIQKDREGDIPMTYSKWEEMGERNGYFKFYNKKDL